MRASDGVQIAAQDTHLEVYAERIHGTDIYATTRILCATFSSQDSSKIAFVTSEGALLDARGKLTVMPPSKAQFGGHVVVINMVSKKIERVYKELHFNSGGVSFNTNDMMVATGTVAGDVIVRNLLNPDGSLE